MLLNVILEKFKFKHKKFGNMYMTFDDQVLVELRLHKAGDIILNVNKNYIDGKRDIRVQDVVKQVDEYVSGKRQVFDIKYKLTNGTDFQKKIWREIAKIKYGRKRTYKQLAILAGSNNAVRAVGSACGKNPVWLIIPCHRVISSTLGDGVGKYAYGSSIKEYLLNIELEK